MKLMNYCYCLGVATMVATVVGSLTTAAAAATIGAANPAGGRMLRRRRRCNSLRHNMVDPLHHPRRHCTRKPRAATTRKPAPRIVVPPPITRKPTRFPTSSPTTTMRPTDLPTEPPTEYPTEPPTDYPTDVPSNLPSYFPSSHPTSICHKTLVHDNHQYTAVTHGNYTWEQAYAIAQTFSCCDSIGHLATIKDAAENDFIRLNLGGVHGWIGFNDKANEGTFEWITGESVTYTNWNRFEPNNSGGVEDCTEIFGSDGGWNDLPCNGERGEYRDAFIVEFDCAPNNQYP